MFKPGHSLESEAILLAASIRHFVTVPVNIYAFIERKDRADVTDRHREIFAQLGVALREIDASGVWKTPYPHGNKILVCAAEYDEDRIIFLDSDMLFLRKTDLAPILQEPLVLCGSLGQKWIQDKNWNAAYKLFGVAESDIPHMPAPNGGEVPSYFNAGMVSFDRRGGFAQVWLKTAQAIDAHPKIQEKRPFLDQIALPVTPFAGGPLISPPATGGFNVRPRRGFLKDTVLAHYTQNYLYLSGAFRVAERVLDRQLGTDLRTLERERIANHIRIIRKRIPPGKKPFVKIWGERHSGTTELRALIEENFDCHVILNPVGNPASVRHALAQPKGMMIPTPFDLVEQIAATGGLGWHAGSPPVDIVLNSVHLPDTLFLCMSRDPFAWMHAMWRDMPNPLRLTPAKQSLMQFISSPFPISARDRVQTRFEATPVEVYQAKLRSYLDFKDICPSPTHIVPFEMLQRADRGLLDILAQYLEPKHSEISFPPSAIPFLEGDPDWTQPGATHDLLGYTEAETKFVNSRLDPLLCTRLAQEGLG